MAACFLFVVLLPLPAFAQQVVGVVTGVQGRVELTRRPTPTPVALQRRDDLFIRDVIDTYEEAIARMLFGGQSTVTVRELTRFEVRAELLPTGARRTTYDLKEGKIRVDAARELMRPGDLIEVRTPNALATVRGTILIAEYISRLGRSFFMCLGGTCRIAIRGLTPFTLVPNKSVTVTGTEETGIQAGPVQSVTPAEAAGAQEGLEMTRSDTAEAGREDIADTQMKTAVQLVEAINGTLDPAEVRVSLGSEDALQKFIDATQDQQPTDAIDPGDLIPPLTPPDTPDVEISGTTVTVTPADAFEFSIEDSTIVLAPGETLKTFSGTSSRSGTSPVVQISGATVTQPGSGLIEVEPGADATLAGQLLEVTNSNLSTGGNLLLVEGALKGTGTAPFIQIDPTTITTGGVGSLTTFDENPPGFVPVDGLTFEGVTYGFSSPDANFGSFGPGQVQFVQDPSLEGNASGVLTLDFTSPVSHLEFGLARSTFGSLTPGSSVTLEAADGSVIGSFGLDTSPTVGFSEGLFVYDGSPASGAVVTFPSAGTVPRFALDNLAIIGGGLISLEGPGASLSVAGSLLQAENLSLTSSAPVLSQTGGSSLTTGGPSFDLVDSDLNLGVLAYFAGGSSYTTTAGPVIRIRGGSLTAEGIALSGGGNTFDFTGSFLDLANTTVSLQALTFPGAPPDVVTFALAAGEPFIRMDNSDLTLTGPGSPLVGFGVDSGAPIDQSGVAVIANPSTINLAGPILNLGGVNLTDPNPQVQLTNTTVTQTGTESLIEVGGQPVTGAGPLLRATDSTITTESRVLDIQNDTFTGTGSTPLLQFDPSTVTTTQHFARVGTGGTLNVAGPFLSAIDTSFTTSDPAVAAFSFIQVHQSATLNSSGSEELVFFEDSSLNTAGAFLVVRRGGGETPSTVTLAGQLLEAMGSSFTTVSNVFPFPCCSFLSLAETGQLDSTGTVPLLKFTNNNNFTGGGNFVNVRATNPILPGTPGPSTMTLKGPLVSDSGGTFDILRFLRVAEGSSLTSTSTEPLIQLSGSTVDTGDDFARLHDPGSKITLSGSLVSAGSTLNIGTDPTRFGDLVDIGGGGQLLMNSAAPVVQLNGGTHTVGTADATANNTRNQLFRLEGLTTDPTTGLGTDQPVKGNGIDPAPFPGALNPIGVLLEATGGATIEVKKGAGDVGGGQALFLDTALLEASAPIISLIGSATAQTSLTTATSTIEVIQSKVTSLGPVVALDKGLINVQSGPLINLTNGSILTVSGDLLSLINGSQINVVNGPLIRVDGVSLTGTSPSVSTLSVSGALVNFGGTGGNQIIVNNSIAPTATLSGLPVSATTGGSIAIGPFPVKNPSLGSISVTGSLIEASNNGIVNIAPAPPQ